jgi:hypothetical protein
MSAYCIATIRLCSKCGKPAGLRGMGGGFMASKYCGDGSDKDNEHCYDKKIIINIPWPMPEIKDDWQHDFDKEV